jgi:8-oxo-dGTP pyrophosphatase MutT (NUDIX family)
MQNKADLLQLLSKYSASDAEEEKSRKEIIKLVESEPRCFENDQYEPGHITGSAFVVNDSLTHTLLTKHVKLNKWLQFGGHSDGHDDPIEVAIREAKEESGLKSLRPFPGQEDVFDMDVHEIPAHGDKPAHKHFDIRILLLADIGELFTITHESEKLEWVTLERARDYNNEPAFLRMVNKAIKLRRHEKKSTQNCG